MSGYKDERDAAAEKYSEGCNAEFERPECEANFKSGCDFGAFEHPRVFALYVALKSWVFWEGIQIEKDGPYIGKEINALINNARAVISDYERAKDEVG